MGWVKGSFFKQRRFHDYEDLHTQFAKWLDEVNNERPSRATGEIPQQRRQQETVEGSESPPTGVA